MLQARDMEAAFVYTFLFITSVARGITEPGKTRIEKLVSWFSFQERYELPLRFGSATKFRTSGVCRIVCKQTRKGF